MLGTWLTLAVTLLWSATTEARVYEKCELARELKYQHKLPEAEIPTWVCIARHESEFNTSAVGHLNWDGSGDHGLFQISDLYWCSPPGKGWSCGVKCADLEDDDLKDDVACVRRIHRQHERLTGDGFTAWAVYRAHCSGDQVKQFVEGCFNETSESNEVKKGEQQTVKQDEDTVKQEVTKGLKQDLETTIQQVETVKQDIGKVSEQANEVKQEADATKRLKERLQADVERMKQQAVKEEVDRVQETVETEGKKVKQEIGVGIPDVKVAVEGRSNAKPKPSRYFAKLYEYVNPLYV